MLTEATMEGAGVASFERFFRAAASLDIDKADLPLQRVREPQGA